VALADASGTHEAFDRYCGERRLQFGGPSLDRTHSYEEIDRPWHEAAVLRVRELFRNRMDSRHAAEIVTRLPMESSRSAAI
jgi:hypothetical protein